MESLGKSVLATPKSPGMGDVLGCVLKNMDEAIAIAEGILDRLSGMGEKRQPSPPFSPTNLKMVAGKIECDSSALLSVLREISAVI